MPHSGNSAGRVAVLGLLVVCSLAAAQTEHDFDGHVKARLAGQTFPDDSIFNELTGSTALDFESDLRLNYSAKRDRWTFDAAYQLFVLYGDRVEYSRAIPPNLGLAFDRLPNDERRLFDLTHVIHDEGKFAVLHRLDRLAIKYQSSTTVVKFGRQAISWGNGLFFSPMDIVNPFDPAAIDTEYKIGDDMLYAQILRKSGDDLQMSVVFRRDLQTGDVKSDVSTAAAKYHGIAGDGEYDILVAQNYGELLVAAGGNRSIGGAVLRGDIVVSDTDDGATVQFVTNLSYSWIWKGKNVSGAIEYFFNGFGQKNSEYDPQSLAENPELLKRIARRELFSLGRNYLAGSLLVELSPLWQLTPTLFMNLDDPSAFLQIITRNDIGQNTTFLGSINIPMGASGSEYGGIPTGMPGQYLSTDFGLFAQLAWYF